MAFKYDNISGQNPEPTSKGEYTIRVPAPTDIWRKPPSHDVFDAPMIYKTMPTSSFKRARVTATGDWKTLYDQGGLVIVLPAKNSNPQQKRWVKAGIEYYNDRLCMSVVAADEWADWSLLPLSASDEKAKKMTVEFERAKAKDGSFGTVLNVYLLGPDGEKNPIREVTWAFFDINEDDEVKVGMYAAKPTKDGREELVVTCSGFELESRD